MQRITLVTWLLVSCIGASAILCKTAPSNVRITSANDTKGFVVMELFTSQGCSSCPSADALLSDYAEKQNDNIIPLAFHVDYWNRLGWKDPFSNPAYSERQRWYSTKVNNASVYTPQLVINGETELVGSETASISAEVNKALKRPPIIQVGIEEIVRTEKYIQARLLLDTFIPNTILHTALVQRKAITPISRGENSGLKLTNSNIVREFKSTSLASRSLTVELPLPAHQKNNEAFLVFYVQETDSGKIIGAVKKSLTGL